MSRSLNWLQLQGTISRELWLDAINCAVNEIPIDSPRDDQLLAWALADYLDVDLRVSGRAGRVYHTDPDCPSYPENQQLVLEARNRECHYCSDEIEGHDFADSIGGMD